MATQYHGQCLWNAPFLNLDQLLGRGVTPPSMWALPRQFPADAARSRRSNRASARCDEMVGVCRVLSSSSMICKCAWW